MEIFCGESGEATLEDEPDNEDGPSEGESVYSPTTELCDEKGKLAAFGCVTE